MKALQILKNAICCVALFLATTACDNDAIVDFGFDGAISGTLKDENGNVVPGSITNTGILVRALGTGDQVTMDMRIDGDGTFQNTKLYPKQYKIWVAGPLSLVDDTLVVDFSKERSVVRDILVRPFVSISQPVVSGTPTSTTVDVDYSLAPNEGKTVAKRELYCSTNPFPDANTGSGPFYKTVVVALGTNAGKANITGLQPNTKYFIRIGAQANGTSAFNYSEQIVIKTQ